MPITRRDQDLRRPHRRLPVAAAAGRRDPGRLRRHHRHAAAGTGAAEREAALAEAERLKREFVGNVSYELRTPLTTIIGYSELLERTGDALPERARGHVAAVRAAASQLARSIDDVLDIAQIDAGEMALDIGDVDVDRAAGGRRRARPAAEAAPARWMLSVAGDVQGARIRADARRLGQILDHLIENARARPRPAAW